MRFEILVETGVANDVRFDDRLSRARCRHRRHGHALHRDRRARTRPARRARPPDALQLRHDDPRQCGGAAATAKAGTTRRRTAAHADRRAAGMAAGASTCASVSKRAENAAMNALLAAGLTARSSERNASPIR